MKTVVALTSVPLTPVPVAGSPLWRQIYPTPRDVRFEVGPFCPVDDTHLHSEMSTGLPGWVCPTCLAWWDLRGRNGQWLADAPVRDASPASGEGVR